MLGLFDTILNNTSLPNLHPAVIHFPIALFPLAIAFDLATLFGRSRALDRVTASLYLLAAVSAWAAAWAGERAADALSGLAPEIREQIEEHEEWAEWFLYAAAAVALARLALAWWERRSDRVGLVPVRGLVVAGALAACVLLAGTADRGGALVYRSGVAVMAVEAPDAPEALAREEGEEPDR